MCPLLAFAFHFFLVSQFLHYGDSLKVDSSEFLSWCTEHGIDRAGALGLIDRELARSGLLDFGRLVYPGFKAPRHIRYLAGLLESAERGEVRRLAISVGPGHGKSTLLQIFLAWFLGRGPGRRILALSAGEMLARRNSRAVRGIVQGESWPWPEVSLFGESLEEWQTTEGGGVRAIGQSGTVTGFRAEMILCDDVQAHAGTATTRDLAESWFREIVSTRLEPDGIVIVIQTRWDDGDLIGRLQGGESADQWTIVNIPTICVDEGDVLGRSIGEALWEERWPLALLEAKRLEIGASAFGAQYQGDPVPVGGKMFAEGWFTHRYEVLPTARYGSAEPVGTDLTRMLLGSAGAARPLPLLRLQWIDCAARTGIRNDRTAIATIASDMRDIFIEHVWVDRVAFPELKRKVVELHGRFEPSSVYVEEASNGYALLDELRGATAIPLVGVPAGKDRKEARAEAVTGLFEAGRIKFPRYAPWLGETLSEFLRFPHGRHDDIVDAVVSGISRMQALIARSVKNERWNQQVAGLDGWMRR